MLKTRITELFQVRHPVVQGGMRGIALAELTAAVANAGCLGFLSTHTHIEPESLRREIARTRTLTQGVFGVNLTVLPNIKPDYEGFLPRHRRDGRAGYGNGRQQPGEVYRAVR
ncbi:NAD(P)H-dependent flavin oxidoreductase YrpB (nitropropane dioxygenase family) [Paraburkholderia sp. UCT70]|uniref:nitronate monooxygenase n=1 Tax=Paraburkholderia sp. UCT70 TaxID=2991068 RepID=UPI003D250D59